MGEDPQASRSPQASVLPTFDRDKLVIRPLAERKHDLHHDSLLSLADQPDALPDNAMRDLTTLGKRMRAARKNGAAVLLLMGAHVIRAGVARQLIDLMERGLITHIGMNGAGGFGLSVELDVDLPGVDAAVAQGLVEAAHQVCPYSNATRGNIDVALRVVGA